MSYLVLQRHANEQIVLTAHPDVSDEDLIRQIRDQGIAVCVTRTGDDLQGHLLRDAPRRLSKCCNWLLDWVTPWRRPWMRLRMRACVGNGWRRGYPGRL
ncbi:hypothetical protein AO942_29825 [Pseudomonas aeruginosa]|nr:hypothetical protein F3G50_05965 [Pseudomonas aeruginosa]MCO2789265.1 hypothetical protein [Pseudomonas aeruginosa]MDV6870766.1 hypothetical protein [Pseudomonas aeruginosa]MDV6890722.1 hypothetical protein [Pseudomonas aeruginosa]OPD82290.1 hypothetical protein AO942_29825 [Pseudomonas aeruginosa]